MVKSIHNTMSTQTKTKTSSDNGITFSVVPVNTIPSVTRGTSKYSKIIDAARHLKIGESIRIPLTNEKGETNRNATATIGKHISDTHVKVEKETIVNGVTYSPGNYNLRLSTRTEAQKVFAYIYYEVEEKEED